MLLTQEITDHLSDLSPDALSVVLEVRNIIVSIAPDATEEIRRQGLVYYDARRGGAVSAGICQILLSKGSIRLAFIHGAFLPDPARLMLQEGERLYKRCVPLSAYENVPWEEITALIQASNRFDPYQLTKKSTG